MTTRNETPDPLLCPLCGKPMTETIKGFEADHVVSEVSYDCSDCGNVGYWAHGYYDPNGAYQGAYRESTRS